MKIDKNAPIGVFDSGVGGLTVAREIIRQIPNERIPLRKQIKGNHYPVFQTDHSFSSGAAGEGGGDRM